MKRRWFAAAAVACVFVAGAAVAPPDVGVVLARIAVFVVSLAVAILIIRRVAPNARSAPDLFDVVQEEPVPSFEIAGLRRIEFDLDMATVHPFGIEWLRPLLRELASGRLLANRGIDMERQPDAARLALGEPLWRMIGDVGRWSGGEIRFSPAEIEAGVARLEEI